MGKDLKILKDKSKDFKTIGLCGGSGAGKGAVGSILSQYQEKKIHVIDADAVYHELISKKSACTDELSEEFGDVILNDDGGVNSKKLAEIVFADGNQDKLKRLNKISHFHVALRRDEIISHYRSLKYDAVVIDAPVLFESGFDSMCDTVVCVIADRDIRISRIIERDKITREKAEMRISKQVSDEFLISHCDYVIYNNSDFSSLKDQVIKVINAIIIES